MQIQFQAKYDRRNIVVDDFAAHKEDAIEKAQGLGSTSSEDDFGFVVTIEADDPWDLIDSVNEVWNDLQAMGVEVSRPPHAEKS